ncbi:MAG TPA: phage tail protein [Candidatus Limnocylindria bacterium]
MPEPAATPPQAPAAGAQPGAWIDPYRAYNFRLDIQGVTVGHFVKCSGLGIRIDAIRYQEGGGNIVHQIPGRIEHEPVTLEYGLTQSTELWTWFMTGVQGKVERRNVSIVMLDPDDITPVLQWDLINAWPSEWRGAPLDALAREIAIESMTLVCESVQRA